MKNSVAWVDLREPPQSLIDLALSKNHEANQVAADDLANYAHEKSVELLVQLLDSKYDRTRDNAIDSLKNILSHNHLAGFRYVISEKITQYLSEDEDRYATVDFLSSNMISQLVIDKMLDAILVQAGRKQKIDDFFINLLFKGFYSLNIDDCAYVTRKIVKMGLVNPGINLYVVSGALKFLYKKNNFSGIAYAIHHLSDGPGYRLSNYKFRYGPKNMVYRDRKLIRQVAFDIIKDAAINKSSKKIIFLKEQIDVAMEVLIKLASKSTKDKNVWTYDTALDCIWDIAKENPDYLKSLPQKTLKLLPQSITDKLKSP